VNATTTGTESAINRLSKPESHCTYLFSCSKYIYTFSDVPTNGIGRGIHILVTTSDKRHLKQFQHRLLPDGMQSFRRCTVRIRTAGDKILDCSQAWHRHVQVQSTRDNKMVVISGRNARLMSDHLLCSLVCGAGTLNRAEYEIRPNTHRRVHSESSIDERGFSGSFL